MRPKLFGIVILLAVVASCQPSKEERAKALYEQAVSAFTDHKTGLAKSLLDSITETYPEEYRVCKEASDMRRTVVTYEKRRTISYLDSVLAERQKEIEPLMKEVDIPDKHAATPVFVHVSQKRWRTFDRCHLRAFVEQNGTMYMSSNFVGEKALHHNRVKIESGESYIVTDTVTDAAFINSFTDGEMVWEVVRYRGDMAMAMAQFVANDIENHIYVSYLGEKARYRTLMTETDKKAIAHIWRLSQLLKESAMIKSKIRETRLSINKKH
ncbi:MAG: hypothetical protein II951_10660 [Bacteroidales bacterium]|nr:hypothetical protein [Bacteroidales bacterium]